MKHLASFIFVVALATQFGGSWAQTSPVVDTILIGDTTNMRRISCLPYDQNHSEDYTQQLILASELHGPALITGIDFYNEFTDRIGRQCTIYLANTYVSRLPSMVPSGAMFQLVAVETFGTTPGWHHIEFDAAFLYDGLGNLLVAVESPWTDNLTAGVYYTEYIRDRSWVQSGYYQSGYYEGRNIMRLHTLPPPTAPASCPASSLRVDAIGPTELKLTHIPSTAGQSWAVACITDGDPAWRTAGYGTGDTSYTLTGLAPSTDYTIRLTSFCTDTFATTFKHLETCCLPEALPFYEDFEGTRPQSCWNYVANPTGVMPGVSFLRGFRDKYALEPNRGISILPLMDAPIDSLEFTCWANNASSNGGLKLCVGIVVNHLDPTSFIPVDTIVMSPGWVPVVVHFDRYQGTVGRIAITSFSGAVYVDDVDVRIRSACPTITEVSFGHVTDTTAMVYWVDSGAASYEVACVPSGSAIDTSHICADIHADSVLLSGLEPNTLYDVYVRSFCNDAYANWSPVISFRTDCKLIETLPFLENFDSCVISFSQPPTPCWRGNVYIVDTAWSGSGSKAICWNWSSSSSYSTEAIVLPAIDIAQHPINTLQISFWARNEEDFYNHYRDARFAVGVMTDHDDLSTFQPLDTVDVVGTSGRRYDVPLADYVGTGCYIAFKACSITDSVVHSWRPLIDDVKVDLIPACPSVTELVLFGFSPSSATVRWNGQESGTTWQVAIDTLSTATPVPCTATPLTSPTYTFDGLAAETSYYVWVRSICSKGDTSEWMGPLQVKPSDSWNMRPRRCDTLSLCGLTLYDDGGAEANFTQQHSRLILLPDTPSHRVIVSGRCNIGEYSDLVVYDGASTSGDTLWSCVYGSNDSAVSFGPIVSHAGPLTIEFEVLFNYPEEGFDLQVSCAPDTCIVHNLRVDATVAPTGTSLALAWDCTGATPYEVEYGPVGFAPGTGTVVTTDSNRFVITGISGMDSLEVHVRSLCSADRTGYWAMGIFHLVGDTTGIDVPGAPKYDIVLYPNPFREVLKIKIGGGRLMEREGAATATLTDVTGRHEEVRLVAEAPGQYSLDMSTSLMLKQSNHQTLLLTLTTDDGKKHTVRLLK